MKLGIVTYMWGADWDLPTLIKNCEATGFEGIELRSTHKHGVEPSLSKEQRAEVRKRFADSKVACVVFIQSRTLLVRLFSCAASIQRAATNTANRLSERHGASRDYSWPHTNPKRQRGRIRQSTLNAEIYEASSLADASGYIAVLCFLHEESVNNPG